MPGPSPSVQIPFVRFAQMISIIWLSMGIGALIMLVGCAKSAPPLDAHAGLRCVDDSPRCVRLRIAALKAMKSDSTLSWINQPVTPKAYATGVRMFSYRHAKSRLTCAQLRHGMHEADRAPVALRSRSAGLSPAQISRGMMLAGEVGADLKREIRRRCQ